MADRTDYYKTLGVPDTATPEAIRDAFRKLARKYHPDVNHAKGAEERFKAVNEAYAVLSDPAKRAEYDAMRKNAAFHAASHQGPGYQRVNNDWRGWGGGNGNIDDWLNSSVFSDLFGGAARQRARHPEPPEETVTVTLEQVATGTTVKLSISEPVTCPECHGAKTTCPRCGGLGKVAEPQHYDVQVPMGVESGQVLRVAQHARLKVDIAPHPRFVREGMDLHSELFLAIPVAAVGGEVSVKPLVGDPVTVSIPPHTNHGRTLRLRGMGLPARKGGGQGDLLLTVVLRFPEPFTAADDRLYQELASNHGDKGGELHAPR